MPNMPKLDIGLMVVAIILAVIFIVLRRQVMVVNKRNANLVKFLKWKGQQMSGGAAPNPEPSSE